MINMKNEILIQFYEHIERVLNNKYGVCRVHEKENEILMRSKDRDGKKIEISLKIQK